MGRALSPATAEGRDAAARVGAKSQSAFRTIAEVSCELDVPAHVLRFWESKFAQVRPLKRRGGRRYYRPEDVDLLRRIQSLLYGEGYTIKGVQRLLRGPGTRTPVAPAPSPPVETSAPPPPAAERSAREAVADVLHDLESIRRLLREQGA